MTSRLRPPQVALLLFCSGFCALIYQTVWLREFRLIFGASTAASAAVLGIFMGGLGLGSAFLGKRAERSGKPLMMYGNLEVLIALFAALSPFLLWLVRSLYITTGGTMVLGSFGGTVVRLLIAGLVLIGPTYLMGGTLPAAARSVASENDQSRRSLALLYGANTMGAVTGTLLSTFLLLEVLGSRATLWLGCGLNLIVALVARAMSRNAAEAAAPSDVSDSAPEIAAQEPSRVSAPLVITASAIVGFAFMMMELVWYRMLSPILGGSTFTFGLILAVALLGIGLGGLAYSLRGSQRPVTLNGFAWTCALEALLIILPFALGDRLALTALITRQFGALGFAAQVLGWGVITSIAVLPAAIVAGYQFPMLIALLGQGRAGVARHTGVAYAANTLGAIIGSLAGGFGLMPLFTAPGLWRAVAFILALLAAVAALWPRRREAKLAWAPLALSCAAIMLTFSAGPTAVWRHGGIGAGRADGKVTSVNGGRDWENWTKRAIIWEAEGVESSVGISAVQALSFVVNGKVDGNSRGDAGTQVMGGLIPAMLHPAPKSALVVGLGTGSTAGWLASLPGMERVDVIELEPAILEVARRCGPVNNNVLSNPKVHVHLGDAREVLITTPRRYDIIFSEPSNPYRAGIASLFTLDFYQSAKQRLEPGGIFAQWVQAYDIQNETLQTVIGTLGSAFSNVQTWSTQRTDLILIASDHAVVVDADQLRKRISEDALKSALFNAWRVNSLEGVLTHFVANENLARAILSAKPELATDDQNPLEYGFARGVGKSRGEEVSQQFRAYSEKHGFIRLLGVRGSIDWEAVENLIPASDLIDDRLPEIPANESASRKKWRIFAEAFSRQDFDGAVKFANTEKLNPTEAMQIEMMATAAVYARDPAAGEWIEKYKNLHPISAEALRASSLAMQSKWSESAEALIKAFVSFRTDPWVSPLILSKLFRTAEAVVRASKSPEIAKALFDVLGEPLAVEQGRYERLFTRFEISRFTEAKPSNARSREALEPYLRYPNWNRGFLTNRVVVYRDTGDPRIESAAQDLWDLIESETSTFEHALKGGSARGSDAPDSSDPAVATSEPLKEFKTETSR